MNASKAGKKHEIEGYRTSHLNLSKEQQAPAIQSPAVFLKRLQNFSYRPQLRSDDFGSKELFAHDS
jgi:hypothetical protein